MQREREAMGYKVDVDKPTDDADFVPIDPGWYNATPIAFEERISAKGNKYLSATFEIIDGKFKKRRVWDNYNLWNRNAHARRFAHDDFRRMSLCIHLDYSNEDKAHQVDTDSLLRKPIRLKLGIREWNGRIFSKVDDYRSSDAVVPEDTGEIKTESHKVAVQEVTEADYDDIPF